MSNAAASMPCSIAESILDRLKERGVELWLDGGSLRFRGPRGALDDAVRRDIAEHRDAIMRALGGPPATSGAQQGDGIRRIGAGRRPPLSFAQKRLWFLDQLDPGAPGYNIGSVVRLRAHVDPAALAAAVDDLFARHATLRTRFVAVGGEPLLDQLAHAPGGLDIVERPGVAPEDRDAAATDHAREALRTRFDLAAGRVALFQLVRFAPDDGVLVFVAHHIAVDGWSLNVIWRDLQALYEARRAGGPAALPDLPLDYVDFAAWEQDQSGGEEFKRLAAFWRETLAGAPVLLELPTDRPRPREGAGLGARYRGVIEAPLASRLRETARQNGTTFFVALLAVWQTLLSRLSGQDDVVVGTPVATREDEGLRNAVGCFLNNVALRGDMSGRPSFAELLIRSRKTVLDAFRHGALPFDLVVESVNPPRTSAHAPIFQTLFTLMDFGLKAPGAGAEASAIEADTGRSRFDLSLELAPLSGATESGALLASYEYDSGLFDEIFAARLHERYVTLLEAACADPAASLHDTPLLTTAERRDLEAWNDTGRPYDRTNLLMRRVTANGVRDPAAMAIWDRSGGITYGQFEERSNRLARALAERGAGPGQRVGVCLRRGADLPVCLAAVLKTGAAYVPIDPAHPADRIALVLADAAVCCVVATENTARNLGEAPLLLLDAEADAIAAQPSFLVAAENDADAVAYVMYTSGSTGRPKGVAVTQGNLLSFLEAMLAEVGMAPGETLLAVTTAAFDISGLEFWLPLIAGGTVAMASEQDVTDGEALARLLTSRDVRLLQATPTTWRLLLEEGWQGKPDLKALCGGEAMPPDLARALLGKVAALWNVYGPTETTIWSTTRRISDADLEGGAIPIGRPIANTRAYVLEPSGLPAPIGAPGELVLAGDGVALGYRDLPDLTADRFVTIAPLGREERAYRTGDLARWRRDGSLEFIGRRDDQVKVRGFRIELGEIEAALAAHPDVRRAFAAVSEGAAGATIVAYLVYAPDSEPTTSEMRRYLRGRLPDYMVPAMFVAIEAAPLSPSGKVDRRRLPDPFRAGKRAHGRNEPLVGDMEQAMAEIWRELLDAEHVGPGDNFFELGGHSLLSLRVAAAVERKTGFRLDPRALFFQTLREVAAGVEQRNVELLR